MDKLFLKKDLVTEDKLTSDGVLAYIALRIIMDQSIPLYNKTSTVDCVSVNRMAYALIGSEEFYEKALIDALQRGVYELGSKNIIDIVQNFSTKVSNEYLFDFTNLRLDIEQDNYVIISHKEVSRILLCKEVMKKKISMLKYFVALISTFNWSKRMGNLQGKIGFMSMEYIASQADNSQRTCIRYNEILSEIRIIYIYKSNDKIRQGDRLKQIKNCYSRYADKEDCEEYASNYENQYGCQHKIVLTKKNKEEADNNRRLAAIYNRICEGYGDTYNKETVKQVYRYVTNKNKLLKQEINDKYGQEDYKKTGKLSSSDSAWVKRLEEQIRDETIFEQFDFLKKFLDDDNWGEVIDFSIEEILDMPTLSEVQMNMAKSVCEGQNDLCKEDINEVREVEKKV